MRLVDVRVLVATRAGDTVESARRTCQHSLVARSRAVEARLEGQELRARADQIRSERRMMRAGADRAAGEGDFCQLAADPSVRPATSFAMQIATR
jgi:hypothetical protein